MLKYKTLTDKRKFKKFNIKHLSGNFLVVRPKFSLAIAIPQNRDRRVNLTIRLAKLRALYLCCFRACVCQCSRDSYTSWWTINISVIFQSHHIRYIALFLFINILTQHRFGLAALKKPRKDYAIVVFFHLITILASEKTQTKLFSK